MVGLKAASFLSVTLPDSEGAALTTHSTRPRDSVPFITPARDVHRMLLERDGLIRM
jgi:hypothetical protein